MPRLSNEVRVHLQKAHESALLAVETYNRPGTAFRSGGYVVLMCIAWTALLHATFFKRGIQPFYRKKANRRHFEILDGDRKAWELTTCVQKFGAGFQAPVRDNILFFVGLRNKIEHRSMPALDVRIFGECQAFLFNFEDVLISEFGEHHALNESLAFSLQFSRMRSEQRGKASKTLHKGLLKNLSTYVNEFRSSLSNDVLGDSRFSFKVFLIPKLANHQAGADAAVEFVKFDPANPESMARLDRVVALIKPSASALTSVNAQSSSESIPTVANVRITNDPDAAGARAIDFDQTHPFLQKRLLSTINARLPRDKAINQYDILAIRRTYDVDSKVNFYHKSLFGSPQYSHAFADWIISKFQQDEAFFLTTRTHFKEGRAPLSL